MKRIDLSVARREDCGKGPNRRLRAEGRIPAVLYGAGGEPEKVSLDAHTFMKIFSAAGSENSLLNIKYADGAASSDESVAVLRELQRDPVTRRPLHADLYRIRMDVENEFDIPVHGTGLPAGVKAGGILETHAYHIRVRCLPANIPTAFDVDLTELQINHAYHASDLPVPDGVTLVTDPEAVVFTVLPPKKEAEPTPAEGDAAAAAPAQPELITKKKEEPEAKA
jgi:large subunit ribosomal protein L25